VIFLPKISVVELKFDTPTYILTFSACGSSLGTVTENTASNSSLLLHVDSLLQQRV
jgi:hypothetical protein